MQCRRVTGRGTPAARTFARAPAEWAAVAGSSLDDGAGAVAAWPGGGLDASLVAMAARSGPQAKQAMRLLTPQVLSRLGSADAGRASSDPRRDFGDYAVRLLGGGTGCFASSGPSGTIRRRGQRASASISRDSSVQTSSARAEPGRRWIDWGTGGKLVDLELACYMLAEITA